MCYVIYHYYFSACSNSNLFSYLPKKFVFVKDLSRVRHILGTLYVLLLLFYYHYFYFAEEKIEAQEDKPTCFKIHTARRW